LGTPEPRSPWDGGVVDPLETRYSPTRAIVSNFVALGQTVWVCVGPKILGMLGPRPLGTGVWLTLETRYSPTCVTVPNSVILVQTV